MHVVAMKNKENAAKFLEPIHALEMLTRSNSHIRWCLENDKLCYCNACYFCAYKVLQRMIAGESDES